jgi:6-pyruvoyltetrahydropterin/6-carboxytetrahydropterin synthase
MTVKAYVTAVSPFEAAREVDILPKKHRSRRLHGHSFLAKVRAELDGELWADFPGDEPRFLQERLRDCVAAFDYRYLNDIVYVPTDENLARYIMGRVVDIPGVDMVGVQCGRMHGHSFEVILHANQKIGTQDMAVDFDTLIDVWKPLHDELQHSCLNDIKGLENPTSEVLAAWIWKKLKPELPELSWVTVYETVTAGCHYDGENYRIWKEMRFESAVRLVRAPDSDKRSQLHGHSFITRLHLSAPLDDVMGWTVDYGDVKQIFKPVYKQLDHHPLEQLPGIEDTDTVSILHWMRGEIAESLPQLDRIDLYETPGRGAFLQWGDNGPALPAQHR